MSTFFPSGSQEIYNHAFLYFEKFEENICFSRMLRREIRERREYLFRKHKEESEAKIRDRKDRLKRALDENKPIPTELQQDALKLQEAIEYDDEGLTQFSHIDDEYKYAGVNDPKVKLKLSFTK
jgi:U3 small nucleolar ribonucleoprotein protein IMP4